MNSPKKAQKCRKDITKQTVRRTLACSMSLETRRQSVTLFDPSWECVHQAIQNFHCFSCLQTTMKVLHCFGAYKESLASRRICKYGIHEKWGLTVYPWILCSRSLYFIKQKMQFTTCVLQNIICSHVKSCFFIPYLWSRRSGIRKLDYKVS